MTTERKQEFLRELFNIVDSSPIGAEELLGGDITSENIHEEWQEFKEEVEIK